MKNQIQASFLVLFSILNVQGARAEEPHYCDPHNFYGKEVDGYSHAHLERVHVFKLGKVTLVGLGVGKSEPDSVEKLGLSIASPEIKNEKYCTFYLNSPDEGQFEGIKDPSQNSTTTRLKRTPKECL